MSIDSPKAVSNIRGTISRDLINGQQKKDSAHSKTVYDSTASSNVKLSLEPLSLSAAVDNAGDIDMDKVQTIKLAIKEGKLVINPQKIADELIKQAIESLATDISNEGKS